ncbi:DNA binding [Tritrichomonas musculus]|uniref:DNA binding n=1 Tax=Tritrichomonas musculus TaxID=1915356 RepID=A0ABR2I5X0_9EUKA
MAQIYTPINSIHKVKLPDIWETINSSGICVDKNHFLWEPPVTPEQQIQQPEYNYSSYQIYNNENQPITYQAPPEYYQYQTIIQPQTLSNMPQSNTVMKKKRKESKRTMFTDSQRTILLEWLRDHRSNPYPTIAEKKQLMNETGLNREQINVWFTNNRIRLGLTGSHAAARHTSKAQMRMSPAVAVC